MFELYKIKNSENLETIAKKYQTSVTTLKEINNIYFDEELRAGTDIIVPKESERYFTSHTITEENSLFGIARKYNVNPELLASMNGIDMDDYIYNGQEIILPKAGYSYYITKAGDTLITTSEMFLSDVESMLSNNPTIYLQEGQILVHKN